MALYGYNKLWVVALILAMVVVAESTSLRSNEIDRIRDCIDDVNEEFIMDSINVRRQLAQQDAKRYISYDALQKDNLLCDQSGSSYYNCRNDVVANPYNRGCTFLTHCARYLG